MNGEKLELPKELTLRDYFAAKVCIFVAARAELEHTTPEQWAAACYEIADAMLAEREKK